MRHRVPVRLLLLLVIAMMPGVTTIAQQPPLPRRLDYAQTIRQPAAQPTLVYIPYQGLGRKGPVYFSEYQEEVLPPSKVKGLMLQLINLTPTAYKDGRYKSFVDQNGIIDDKVLPVPEAGQCQVRSELQQLLASMSTGYPPSILGGNWPVVCSLSIWFPPEDETSVASVIAANHAISLGASVPLCAPTSPQVDSPAIVQRLRDQHVWQTDVTREVSGNMWDVLYATVMLARDEPKLFGTPDPREGWQTLMAEFTFDDTAHTAILRGYPVEYPVYVCRPDPFEIRF